MYIKKIIIMNEVTEGFGSKALRGLATLQTTGKKAECDVNIFNLDLKSGTNFLFGVLTPGGKLQQFRLTSPTQRFQMADGSDLTGVLSCILVCRDKAGRPVPVMWGSNGPKRALTGNMTDGFRFGERSEKEDTVFRQVMRDGRFRDETQSLSGEKEEYCDYAVAAENYYPYDYGALSYYDTGAASEPPVKAYGGTSSAGADGGNTAAEREGNRSAENADGNIAKGTGENITAERQESKIAENNEERGAKDTPCETATLDSEPPKRFSSEEEPRQGFSSGEEPPMVKSPPEYTGGSFYMTIKSQLDELFASNPKEEFLCGLFRGTDWAKIAYDDLGQYYTVGVLYDEGRVKYVCYGVPGEYAPRPPRELEGFCQWLPLDAGKPEGEGYWMMYQDAETGKSVSLDII